MDTTAQWIDCFFLLLCVVVTVLLILWKRKKCNRMRADRNSGYQLHRLNMFPFSWYCRWVRVCRCECVRSSSVHFLLWNSIGSGGFADFVTIDAYSNSALRAYVTKIIVINLIFHRVAIQTNICNIFE